MHPEAWIGKPSRGARWVQVQQAGREAGNVVRPVFGGGIRVSKRQGTSNPGAGTVHLDVGAGVAGGEGGEAGRW